MNEKVRIEVDEATALVLEARAAASGMTVAQLVADLAGTEEALPADVQALREAAKGPWAPDVLAEDARRLADFRRTGEGGPLGGCEGLDGELGHARRATSAHAAQAVKLIVSPHAAADEIGCEYFRWAMI